MERELNINRKIVQFEIVQCCAVLWEASCFLRECPKDRRCVSPLDRDADESLTQELSQACVVGASRYTTSNFLAQRQGRGTPGFKRFHRDRRERVIAGSGEFNVLCPRLCFRCLSSRPCRR